MVMMFRKTFHKTLPGLFRIFSHQKIAPIKDQVKQIHVLPNRVKVFYRQHWKTFAIIGAGIAGLGIRHLLAKKRNGESLTPEIPGNIIKKRNGESLIPEIPGLIIKKRNGESLTPEEIEYFVEELVNNRVQECQLGAMLMAIYLKGLTDEETVCLTGAMRDSGDVLGPWPAEWKGKVVDKHSTGGVGDKISLILAPALAACGMKVPMVSGRGLGHTGGTLDKLESIPGLSVSVSKEKMEEMLTDVGCCIVGQTEKLVPADKKMYAARDVTGTVDNIGLIAASIISKKAAEKLDVLVLDVKYGVGAVIVDEAKSRELVQKMVIIGNGLGIKTVALMTDMNNPIGKMIGNALEIAESLQCLHGQGPSDLEDLVLTLGGQLLFLSGQVDSVEKGEADLKKTLNNGEAVKKFQEMIIKQGVDPTMANDLCATGADVIKSILQKSKRQDPIKSTQCGTAFRVSDVTKGLLILFEQEIKQLLREKEYNGQPWIIVHHNEDAIPDDIKEKLIGAIDIQPSSLKTRVLCVISKEKLEER